MELGLFMNTHGIGATVDGQWTLQRLPASEMRPLDVAKVAEAAGFHSLWFSDHVLVTLESESLHTASDPVTGKRAYPQRPEMLDCMVIMGAVAAVTERIKLAPSVLVVALPASTQRRPLPRDRRRVRAGSARPGDRYRMDGRGVHRARPPVRGPHRASPVSASRSTGGAGRDEVVEYEGDYFSFSNVSMDPKPKAMPPIVFGGVTKAAARIAARSCDGFYPTFVDPLATADRYDGVLDVLAEELAHAGRDRVAMRLAAVLRVRILDPADAGSERMLGTGTAEEVLDDLAALAATGFAHVVVHLDCRSTTMDEYWEQLRRLGELVPAARSLAPAGGWSATPL